MKNSHQNVIFLQLLAGRSFTGLWHRAKHCLLSCVTYGLLLMAHPYTNEAFAFTAPEHRFADQTLAFDTEAGTVSIVVHHEHALEVVYDQTGVKQLPSFAIAPAPGAADVDVDVQEDADTIVLSTPSLTATINKRPLRISYARNGETFLEEEKGLFVYDTIRGFRFKLKENEKLMGGGQRVLGMNRRGYKLPLDNRGAYGYSDEADAMYYGIPAVVSDQKYLLLFDNTARGYMDLGHSEKDIMQFQAEGGRTAYLVVSGETYPQIIENYVEVTGKQSMLPRWAFGNFASRFGYRSEKQAREVVDQFRQQDIPLDAIIFDIFWFGPDIKGHMGNLDWDRKAFPTPEKMIDDFSESGIKTVLITEPFILNTSKRWQEAKDNSALAKNPNNEVKVFDFFFGTSGLVDVFSPPASDWFWDKHNDLLKQGVEGIWGDLGEPEAHPEDTIHAGKWTADEVHNAYGHQWAKIIYDNHLKEYPGKRPFLMMRSGFAGSQRFGMVPWSGDVSRTWEALQAQIEIGLQMGLLGLGYSHSDLGGFVALDPDGESDEDLVELDEELYVRWLQYGTFQPIYRPHSQEQIAPEPIFYNGDTRRIVRRYIKLRYQLLPYLYTMAYQNSLSGLPLMRPLLFTDESNSNLFDNQDAYLWGNDLLIAPVTEKQATRKRAYLPDGVWFDLFNGTKYQGGKEVSIPVTLEDIPVLVRGGAFIPMINSINSTADYTSDELIIHHYHDDSVAQSNSMMYEDDGASLHAKDQGLFELLHFSQSTESTAKRLTFTRETRQPYAGRPDSRRVTLVVHNWPKAPTAVNLVADNDRSADQVFDHRYSAKDRTLTIEFNWVQDNHVIEIR